MAAVPPEADAFLRAHTRAFLLTLRRDGSPTGHPMTALYRDGRLYFNTYRKSAKVRNLERDPRVCCLVTTAEDQTPPRGVVLEGTAEILSEEEALAFAPDPGSEVSRLPERRSIDGEVVRRTRDRLVSGKRVLVCVTPHRVLPLGT